MKKILCILLASLMLLSMLASCGEAVEENPTETQAPGATGAVTEGETREPLEIPDTRYDDMELVFLTRDESEWSTIEIFTEKLETSTDNIATAVYERNDMILQKYGVTIKELKQQTGLHSGSVSKEVSAPTGDFQAISTNAQNSASYATQGYLWNLVADEVEYMDFSKPWWDSTMAEGLSIEDHLYFVTGDIFTLDNDATFVILFNKQLVIDCQIPDLYDMVENGEWTLDAFYEYEQLAVQDKNGNGTLEYDSDVCGFAYTNDSPFSMLFGSGVTLVSKDENDTPYYEMDVERASNVADKCHLIFSKDYVIDMNAQCTTAGIGIMPFGQQLFGGGHALFFGEVMQAVTRMRGFEVDFGILPYPKFDKAQPNHISMMHRTASMLSIPKSVTADELVMVESMIEAMAYYAVDTITEQYYEINLKTRDSKDERSGPMMDLILANRACDLSYYYSFGSDAYTTLASTALPNSGKAPASLDKTFSKAVERSISQFLKKLDRFDEN